jgi:cation:H+ antiporter
MSDLLYGLLGDLGGTAEIALSLVVILVATVAIWRGSGWLESSAEELSAHYGLPAVVQGSVVVAVGSSFPELASVVFTAIAGVFDMGVGAVVGSAVFNILVVPGAAGVATEDPLDSSRTLVYKEAQFYMIAVSALVVTFAMAVIYFPTGGEGALLGELGRPLALVPLGLYCLYLFIQWQDVGDHDAAEPPEDIEVGRQWGLLAAGLLVILVAVEQLVAAVEILGVDALGVPEFLAGVVIIAAATSLPDTLVSVRAARAGKDVTSLGNVLGSNTFDLLVAIPLGVLIVGSVTINFGVAVPMMGVLTVATILLFTVLRTDMGMSDLEAWGLLVAYGLFVAWIAAETAGLVQFLPR